MLIDDRHVLTCAHVVAQLLGTSATIDEAPLGVVGLDFPFGDNGSSHPARVVGWFPLEADGSGDFSVLRLETPVSLAPAPLCEPPLLEGHAFSVHGFPHGNSAIRQAKGMIGGASGPTGEWTQLTANGADGPSIERGFSGSPVFDANAGGVVGIVAMRDDFRTGHMLPLSSLRARWPQLTGRIRWRLDLSPSLPTHWLPRARGIEPHESDWNLGAGPSALGDLAWYFTGRHAARAAICAWLAGDGRLLAVTGGPGTGKSALLAHLLIAADPILGAGVPAAEHCPPMGSFDVAVTARGHTVHDTIDALAVAVDHRVANDNELVVVLRSWRKRHGRPISVIVDAVEEAATVDDARRIAALLRLLAASGTARILTGIRTAPAESKRARILEALGRDAARIDLESRRFLRNYDIAEYVERRLIGRAQAPGQYRDRPAEELRTIGRAVAARSRYNFLIAQLVAQWLNQPDTPAIDITRLGWEQGLPETVGQAMDAYLESCDVDNALVRRLLSALAHARGEGLAPDRTWLTIADAIHVGRHHQQSELGSVFDSAAHYLVERTGETSGAACYRLYHDALDEHLRAPFPQQPTEDRITKALAGVVDSEPDGCRRWETAVPYTRAHLAGHAADAGRLDELLNDGGFLVHADTGPLLSVLYGARAPHSAGVAAAYRASSHLHREQRPLDRLNTLALDAARLGAKDLLRTLDHATTHVADPGGGPRWHVRWASEGGLDSANIASLRGHSVKITGMSIVPVDGAVTAVTSDIAGVVRSWDLEEQRLAGELTVGDDTSVLGVAITELDGRPTAVILDGGGGVRLWDLGDFTVQVAPTHEEERTALCLAAAEVMGEPLIAIGGTDACLRLWDPVGQSVSGRPLTGHRGAVTNVVTFHMDGRPIAATGGTDGTVRLWDLAERRCIGLPLTGHSSPVSALAITEVAGRTVVVSAGDDRRVRLWDPATGGPAGALLTEHAAPVTALATGVLNDRGVLAIGDAGGKIQLWDLENRRLLVPRLEGNSSQITRLAFATINSQAVVAAGHDDGQLRLWDAETEGDDRGPHPAGHRKPVSCAAVAATGGSVTAVTGSADGSLRLWDLADGRLRDALTTAGAQPILTVTTAALADETVLISTTDQEMLLWRHDSSRRWTGTPLSMDGLTPSGGLLAVTAVRSGRQSIVATGGMDQTIRLWDPDGRRRVKRGLPRRPVQLSGHVGDIVALEAFVLQGRPMAVSGSVDGALRLWDLSGGLWDLRGGRPLGDVSDGHRGSVRAVTAVAAPGDSGALVLSGGDDRVLRLWRATRDGLVPLEPLLGGHTAAVTVLRAAILPDGRQIAVSGGDDRTLRVWDLETGSAGETARFTFPARITALALTAAPTGERGMDLVVGFDRDVAAVRISS